MAKVDFKLKAEPEDKILFTGDLKEANKVELKLTNPTDDAKAVKVKCTDNSLFRIRPPTALVKAGESVTISLSCSSKDGPPKSSHHFVVQHTDAGDAANARKAFEANAGNSRLTIPIEFKSEEKEEKEEEKEEKEEEKEEKEEEKEEKEEEKEEKKEEKDEEKEEKKGKKKEKK